MGRLKRMVILAAVFCTCFGMPATVSAEPKTEAASLDDSGYLRYVAEGLSWDTEGITLSGYFVNISSDQDVYGLTDGTLVINDAAGTPAISTSLNSRSLGEVSLGPGEKWTYTVEREISGFDPDAYNVRTFSTSVACEFSIRSHTKNCSGCGSRGAASFATEDTMSEEAWQQLLAKLKSALDDGDSGQKASSVSGGNTYTPALGADKTSICSTCGGAGSRICEKCNGLGYKMIRKRVDICQVLHHSDCPAFGKKTGKCNDCHTRHDYYDSKQKCIYCEGSGKRECTRCGGTGKR